MARRQFVDLLAATARIDVREHLRRSRTSHRELSGPEGHGGDQFALRTPAIEQRENTETAVDRAPCVWPSGQIACATQHPVPIRGDFIVTDSIPLPAIRLASLPPVVERFGVSPPGRRTPRSSLHQRQMQKPRTCRFDQPHLRVEQYRDIRSS
jgi:hypothetical protein